jgi:hypothetical protein
MKRFVLSIVAAGSVAASPFLAAGPAFASGDEHQTPSNHSSTVCSNGGLLQLQVVCIGSIAVPVIVNVLSGDNILSGGSLASNSNEQKG